MALQALLNKAGGKLSTNYGYTIKIRSMMGIINNIHTNSLLKREKDDHPWSSDPSSSNYQWGSPNSTDTFEHEDTYDKRNASYVRQWHSDRFENILKIAIRSQNDPCLCESQLNWYLDNVSILVMDGPDDFRDMPKDEEENAYKIIQHVFKMKNLCENEQLELVRVLDARFQIASGYLYRYVLEVMQAGKLETYLAKVCRRPWLNNALHVYAWCQYDPMPY